jgi:Kdo2-lipid IVA lauroyltransferase/acyltransferase
MVVFSFLLYYLVIIPISLLPFRVLYWISDFLFLILYRLGGYRTRVVRTNLKNSFPDKTATELIRIEKLFYHHLCDVIVETFKSFTISGKEILKRMVVQNPELLNTCYDEGRSVLLGGGHFNNWEWIATSLHQQIRHQAVAFESLFRTKNAQHPR